MGRNRTAKDGIRVLHLSPRIVNMAHFRLFGTTFKRKFSTHGILLFQCRMTFRSLSPPSLYLIRAMLALNILSESCFSLRVGNSIAGHLCRVGRGRGRHYVIMPSGDLR